VDLPEKYRIDIKRTVFSKPEIQFSALPQVAKLEYKVQSFKRAELQVPVLSPVSKVGSDIRTFKNQSIRICFACDSKNKYCNREFQASEGNAATCALAQILWCHQVLNSNRLKKLKTRLSVCPRNYRKYS